MKKQYINPDTIIVNVKTQRHMLFGSETGENTINGGGAKGVYSGSGQLSRRGGSDWDDEEE